MFNTTLFGTFQGKTLAIGTYSSINDIRRAEMLMLNDDLRANSWQAPGFVLLEGMAEIVNSVEIEVALSHWTTTQEA